MIYKFGQLFEIIDGDRGKNYPGDSDFFDEGYCLFLNAGNVTKSGWSFESNAFIAKEKDEQLRKGRANRGDTVFTTRGTVGNAAYYGDKVPFENIRINSGMVILRPKDEAIVDNEFIYYLVTSPLAKKTIELYCSGSAQPQLPIKDFVKIKYDLPSIAKQRQIVSVLNSFDNLIEVNNKRIKVLEQMAENLYKEWFVRFRFPGYESAKFENSLPEGWKIKPIRETFDTFSGGTPSRQNTEYYENGHYMWVKTGELLDRFIIDTEERITEEAIKNSSAKLIQPFSLMCSMYAGVGKLGINAEEMTCSQATCVFVPKTSCSIYYLFFWLKLNREYLENISFGAAQQNISQDIIRKIKTMVPDSTIAKKFDNTVWPLFQQILILQKQNKNLVQQRDLLLPCLMSGKLEV